MNCNKTLIIGTGGLSRQLEYHYSQWRMELPIFFDNVNNIEEYNNYEVINNLDNLPEGVTHFVVAISDLRYRERLTQMCLSCGLSEKNIISEDLHLPYSSFVEMNSIILRNCLIEPNVKVGYGNILNAKVSLYHDVKLGKYVVIGPSATLLGNVEVGDNCFIGAGSIIREKIKIGKNCIIGMGSVVLKNIPDNQMWFGNPAKFIKNL